MYTLYDEFAGVGGSSLGASRVPGVEVIFAANHWDKAIETHQANFPEAGHHCGDVMSLDMDKAPRADIFWASPACPPWTDARGKKRDFDQQTIQQGVLFGEDPLDPSIKRARALMEEVVRYLRAKTRQGKPVLVGVVENVIQCRLWAEWDRWIWQIESEGYTTRVIAFNSMHARAPRSARAPQSRDRLYVAYWHNSLGRRPDFDKWLRPTAWCPICAEQVRAMQVFKKPGVDMGRYRAQYVYRCPRVSCRHQPVEPDVVPALSVIDPGLPGVAIKDRPDPLAEATVDRIKAGMRRYWLPMLTPAGGTWRDDPVPLHLPMPARTTRESDGVAVPPLLPAGTRAASLPVQAAVADPAGLLPFLTPLRGGGDKGRARAVQEPLTTVTASGNHHGLALPPLVMRNNTPRGDAGYLSTPVTEPLRSVTTAGHQSLISWSSSLLVPYYGNTETAIPAAGPVGALTARARYGVAHADRAIGVDDLRLLDGLVDDLIGDVRFRMLTTREIGDAMAIDRSYRVLATTKKDITRLYGNAVTPPVAELIVSALVEAISGEQLEVAA